VNAATARHEARHASAGLLRDLPVTRASAIPNAASPGRVNVNLDGLDRDSWRDWALLVLCGKLGDRDWPPAWPNRNAETTDEQHLAVVVSYLGLDQKGWDELVTEAWDLSSSPAFERLENALASLLEQGHVLDERSLKHIHAITEAKMEHLTKSASAVVTDLGEFLAIAATWEVDRQGDKIQRGAFGKSIAQWRASRKMVPVHWNHEGSAASIIGGIDPNTMRETAEGLRVRGQLDLQDSETAREAWRSMRNERVGLSFGFLVNASHDDGNGVRVLTEIDLFEVSITASPVSAGTRILSMKSLAATAPLTTEELRRRCRALGIAVPTTEELRFRRAAKAKESRQLRRRCTELALETAFGGPLPEFEPEPVPTPAEQNAALRRQLRELMS
jgi:HK97 family phage prohead protease